MLNFNLLRIACFFVLSKFRSNTWEPEENIIDTALIVMFNESRKKVNEAAKKVDKNETVAVVPRDSSRESGDENLRSVKRIAEGLRPIATSSSAKKSVVKKKRVSKLSMRSKTRSSRSPSNCSQKSSNTSVTSLSVSTKNSNESPLVPTKKRIILNRLISSDDDDDGAGDIDSNNNNSRGVSVVRDRDEKSNEIMAHAARISNKNNNNNNINNENKIIKDDLVEIDGDVYFKNLLDAMSECQKSSQDVFVTDVTSGVVTVTIKECCKTEGFFKKRDSLD